MSVGTHPVREYRERHGLSQEDLAAFLTVELGREIKPKRIKDMEERDPRGRRIPKSYAAAMGMDATGYDRRELNVDSPDLGGAFSGADAASGADGDPPMMPPGGRQQAPPAAPPSGDFSLVRDRIAKAYNAVGAGVTMATRNDGYSAITSAYSPDLAKAWTAAAQENKQVAKIVEFMESGGPVGELVVAHVILVLGFVYVSGRAPSLGALYDTRFGVYHRRAAASLGAPPADGAGQQEGVGVAGANGAQGPLGDAATIPRS